MHWKQFSEVLFVEIVKLGNSCEKTFMVRTFSYTIHEIHIDSPSIHFDFVVAMKLETVDTAPFFKSRFFVLL